MKVHNKFLVPFVLIPFIVIFQNLCSDGEGAMRPAPIKRKPLDTRLYQPPTLKLRCLLALRSHNLSSSKIPNEVLVGAQAFQNIHNGIYSAQDLKDAFNLATPTELQKKVSYINQKAQERFNQLQPIEAAIPNQKYLSLFDNLFLMLEANCEGSINKGLIQLGRLNSYRKGKVLSAILLHLGADVNFYGTVNYCIRATTPLITATIYQETSYAELLLKCKANINAQEADGYNAYTLAKRTKNNGSADLVNLLRSFGGIYIPVKSDNTCPICPNDQNAFSCSLQ